MSKIIINHPEHGYVENVIFQPDDIQPTLTFTSRKYLAKVWDREIWRCVYMSLKCSDVVYQLVEVEISNFGDTTPVNEFTLHWNLPSCGFGQLYVYFDDAIGETVIDCEGLPRRSVVKILQNLGEKAILDSETVTDYVPVELDDRNLIESLILKGEQSTFDSATNTIYFVVDLALIPESILAKTENVQKAMLVVKFHDRKMGLYVISDKIKRHEIPEIEKVTLNLVTFEKVKND